MDLVGAALTIAFVLALHVLTTIPILRQNGRLLARIDTLEARVGITTTTAGQGEPPKGPPALGIGDQVPALELAALDRTSMNLAGARIRNLVLMFWDPRSEKGLFMLPDLRTWSRVSAADWPQIVLVASDEESAKQAVDLEMPILLDPDHIARELFGVVEYPSAVLIDREGRVASNVEAGYVPAFELTKLAPYVPTELPTVAGMLKLADVRADDVVYDIGCGDGRIVVMAAEKYGARAVGVDVNPVRLAEGRANAKKASVEHLVRFEQSEFMDCDLREATVVTLYLLPGMVQALRSKLMAELRPGARIVAHGFPFDGWTPELEATVNGDSVYLWTV